VRIRGEFGAVLLEPQILTTRYRINFDHSADSENVPPNGLNCTWSLGAVCRRLRFIRRRPQALNQSRRCSGCSR
jgi:hypothetical protein